MIQARDNFVANIERAQAIRQVYAALTGQVTGAIDLSDLLRFEIAQAVSALDCLVHDVILIGMLQVIQGQRQPTEQFRRFKLSMATTIYYSENRDIEPIEQAIREHHSYMSFQSPDKISQAFRLISPIDLWGELEIQLDNPRKALKQQLSLIVDRRNKIVHEGDLSPTFPRRPWTISTGDALQAREFIEHLGHNILLIAECDGSS